jgi:hypothetical protein
MWFANRGSRPSDTRREAAFQPGRERLEDRCLLAIDLGGQLPPALPNIAVNNTNLATTGPFGVVEGGANLFGGVGWSVSDLGDINNDGFDDFWVGAPGVAVNASGGLSLSGGRISTSYLIYGSQGVTSGTLQSFNWLNLDSTPTAANGTSTNQRVGDLAQLGNDALLAFNPITNSPTFPFSGIPFITSQNTGSQLGSSVSVVRGLPGGTALLIGAPGERTFTGQATGGAAFLIYTNNVLNGLARTAARAGAPIDLDSPGAFPTGLNVVTFTNTVAGSQSGFSVAGAGDVFVDGVPDVAIGAPGYSNSNFGLISTGATYLVSGAALPQTTTTVPLNLVGQTAVGQPAGGIPGLLFVGGATGVRAGFSVSTAGQIDGRSTGTGPITGLLIGAPGDRQNGSTTTGGQAYLINGQTPAGFSTTGIITTLLPSTTSTLSFVNLAQLDSPTPNTTPPVPPVIPGNVPLGAVFNGLPAGSLTGFSVAQAGDFNADALGDFMIGSPGANNNAGQVNLIYGSAPPPQLQPSGAFITGVVSLTTAANGFGGGAIFTGPANSLAGFSESVVGSQINADPQTNSAIAIGAPGFNSNMGAVYLIPGRSFTSPQVLNATYPLTDQTAPVLALLITISNTPAGTLPVYLGASVSGRLETGQTFTADSDSIADFIIGAPGYSVANNRALAGGVFIIEGGLLRAQNLLQTPTPGVTPPPPPPPSGVITPIGGTGTITVLKPQFGPDHFVPPVSALSAYTYKAIPLNVAYHQYLPAQGFRQRIKQYFFPQKFHNQFGSRFENTGGRTSTLGRNVFTRGKFKPGKTISFTHPVPVIPIQLQHQTFTPTPDIKLVRKRSLT